MAARATGTTSGVKHPLPLGAGDLLRAILILVLVAAAWAAVDAALHWLLR
jgi:hypothetical protein